MISVGSKGRVIHIAHSQGALLTSLAAKQLSPWEMSRIEVLAFGGAAAIRQTSKTPFHRCINYYALNDPLLLVVPSAEQALRSGYVMNDEFCFLVPRTGDPLADHQLLGPTYGQALYWEGLRFQRRYQNLAFRGARFTVLMFLMAFQAFSSWLRALVAEVLRQTVRWALSIVQKASHSIDYLKAHVFKPLCGLVFALVEFFRRLVKSLNYSKISKEARAFLSLPR